jgi:hypothetical protein
MTEFDFEVFALTKSTEWKYEEEWRLIRRLAGSKRISKPPYDICLFDIPCDAITSITFGARCPEKKRLEIQGHVKARPQLGHIEIYECRLSETYFALERTRHA